VASYQRRRRPGAGKLGTGNATDTPVSGKASTLGDYQFGGQIKPERTHPPG
jgi:hypothetical protein